MELEHTPPSNSPGPLSVHTTSPTDCGYLCALTPAFTGAAQTNAMRLHQEQLRHRQECKSKASATVPYASGCLQRVRRSEMACVSQYSVYKTPATCAAHADLRRLASKSLASMRLRRQSQLRVDFRGAFEDWRGLPVRATIFTAPAASCAWHADRLCQGRCVSQSSQVQKRQR